MNKSTLPELEQKFASFDKKAKIQYIDQAVTHAFRQFTQKLSNPKDIYSSTHTHETTQRPQKTPSVQRNQR